MRWRPPMYKRIFLLDKTTVRTRTFFIVKPMQIGKNESNNPMENYKDILKTWMVQGLSKETTKKLFSLSFIFFYLVLKKYLPPRVSLSNPFQNIPKYCYAKKTHMWMWHIIKNIPHLLWDAIDVYRQRHIHIRFRNPLTVLLRRLWWQKGWGGLHVCAQMDLIVFCFACLSVLHQSISLARDC